MKHEEEQPKYKVRYKTRRWLYRFGYTKDDIQQEIALVETIHGGFAPIYTRFHLDKLLTKNFCPSRQNKKGRNVSFESCTEDLVRKLATNSNESEDELLRNELIRFANQIITHIRETYEQSDYYIEILTGKITVAEYARVRHRTRQNCIAEINRIKQQLFKLFGEQYKAYQ